MFMKVKTMNDLLNEQKNDIIKHIEKYFENYSKKNLPAESFKDDFLKRLFKFISKGKLIRGILAVSSYETLGGTEQKKILSIASAIELLHAGFLMHDDVMDGDILRRGAPAIHVSYGDLFSKKGLSKPEKNGESFAICLGNIAYFLSFDLIASSGFDPETINRLIRIFNREAVATGLGQMDDIITGSSDTFPETEAILNIYRMKTARYTFSLPLIMGAACAGLDDQLIEQIVEPAEGIGLVFQMRDDELNLLSDSSGTGKSIGSDIAEGKKTMIMSMLLKNIKGKEKETILSIFAKKSPNEGELNNIKKMIVSSGTLEEHRLMIKKISDNTSELIRKLKVSENYKKILEKILEMSIGREY